MASLQLGFRTGAVGIVMRWASNSHYPEGVALECADGLTNAMGLAVCRLCDDSLNATGPNSEHDVMSNRSRHSRYGGV